jgi:hypothetical protein
MTVESESIVSPGNTSACLVNYIDLPFVVFTAGTDHQMHSQGDALHQGERCILLL